MLVPDFGVGNLMIYGMGADYQWRLVREPQSSQVYFRHLEAVRTGKRLEMT